MEGLHLGIHFITYMKDIYIGKLLLNYFVQSNKLILNFIQPFKCARIPKTTLEKKSKFRIFVLSDFQTYYKPVLIKTMWRDLKIVK